MVKPGQTRRVNPRNGDIGLDLVPGMKVRPIFKALVKRDISNNLTSAKIQFIPKKDGPSFEALIDQTTSYELIDTRTRIRYEQLMRWAQKCNESLD